MRRSDRFGSNSSPSGVHLRGDGGSRSAGRVDANQDIVDLQPVAVGKGTVRGENDYDEDGLVRTSSVEPLLSGQDGSDS